MRNAIGHGAILAAPPAAPTACRRQQAFKLAALFRREHLGGVSKGLGEPLAQRVDRPDLLGAQLLDRRTIDALTEQEVARRLPRGEYLFPHGEHVLDRVLDDAAQLFLLLGGGVDLDRNMSDHPIRPLLGGGRIEPAAEGSTVPIAVPVPIAMAERWSEALTERSGGESADAREAEAKCKGNCDFCKPARPRHCGRSHGGG